MRFQADGVQQFGHARIDLRARRAGQLQREGDIGRHGARGEQVEVLEDHADLPAQHAQALGIECGDILAIDQQAAAGGLLQSIDQADQGGFARTGMADDAEHFAGLDGQVQRLQRGNRAAADGIGFVQALELDHFAVNRGIDGRGRAAYQRGVALARAVARNDIPFGSERP